MVKAAVVLKNAVNGIFDGPKKHKMTGGNQLLRAVLTVIFRTLQIMFRVALSVVYSGPGEELPPIDNLILLDSATSLARKIRTGKLTSLEVVQSFANRIRQVNPILNCVVDDRIEEALAEAAKVDALIASGEKTREEMERETPFLGVPFTTKDAISIKGLSNTAGLWSRKGVVAEEDSDAVALLRRAGGIPIAITNISEVCMFWESNNPVYGRSCNPYNTNRIVGGSSGGEGCVLASAASPMGWGSDIGGSVRMPAFFNGVFGHKPSSGIGSLKGHYPIPKDAGQLSYLTIGPMSRFASDLLPMFKVLAPKSVVTLRLEEKVDVTKLKYYYMEDDGGGMLVNAVEPEIKDCVRRVVSYLDKTHGVKAQRVDLGLLRHSMVMWFAKMQTPGGDQMPAELANHKEPFVNIWKELLKFPLGLSRHTLPILLIGVLEKFNVKHGSPKHQHLVEKCSHLKAQFQDMLGADGVFIYPTHPTAAPYHVEPLIKGFNASYTAVFNVLGLPATHCPMGLNGEGLPIGLQVVAGLNQDRLSLAVALELEKAFGGWVPLTINI